MVIPLWDDNSDRRTTPYVNYGLIAVNVFVFVVLQRLGNNDRFTYAFACVPAEIVSGHDLETAPKAVEDPVTGEHFVVPGLEPMPLPLPDPLAAWVTLLTSMFLHGGIAHIAGNMLFLWIFGDNVEDYLGHVRYLFFYLVCGVLASLAHVASTYAFNGDPMVPSLGASGAISGVLGGVHPGLPAQARDGVAVPLHHAGAGVGGRRHLVRVPAGQRHRRAGARLAAGRRRLRGPRRRLRGRHGPREGVRAGPGQRPLADGPAAAPPPDVLPVGPAPV
jgi:membrane associated rhomboid family serine protease